MKGGGVGMRGIISALSLQPTTPDGGSGMLAAGTWTRWVGLYDAEGMGGTVANWSIESAADGEASIGGAGVSQVLWSACGRYLLVVERQSRGVLVYDVRVTGRLVAWCSGRKAETNQRIGVDVFGGEKGSEIWSGGTDGVVKVWESVGMSEGAMESTWEWAAHEDAVGGVAVHPGGSVVATSSGQRKELFVEKAIASSSGSSEEDHSEDDIENSASSSTRRSSRSSSILQEKTQDNSLKIWSLL
jgi:WD40 repeat protein